MPAVFAALAAAAVEIIWTGIVNGATILVAAVAALVVLVVQYRRASARLDRLNRDALHPNRQRDREDRIRRAARREQVRL